MTQLDDTAGVQQPAGTPADVEEESDQKTDRLLMLDDFDDDLEHKRRARAHFPHLASHVQPRESDEYPTFWEGQ